MTMGKKVVAIIQARMGSSRLPGKILMAIDGKPVLKHVIERAKLINGVDAVVVNVPEQDGEMLRDAIPDALIIGVKDQEKDVLKSYREVAQQTKADVIMRLTADCPLLDPEICAHVLRMYNALSFHDDFVYCANDTVRSGYPDGTDCEIFSMYGLQLAHTEAKEPLEREHVTPWLRKHLPCYTLVAPYQSHFYTRGHLTKWSVDQQDDLEMVRGIFRLMKKNSTKVQDAWEAYEAYLEEGAKVKG